MRKQQYIFLETKRLRTLFWLKPFQPGLLKKDLTFMPTGPEPFSPCP